MEIYKTKDLQRPNFIQKLFGQIPSENAIIEVNNLFSSNQKDIEKISFDQIIAIADNI